MKLPPARKIQDKNQGRHRTSFQGDQRFLFISILLFFSGAFLMTFFGFKTIIGLFDFLKLLAVFVLGSIGIQLLFRQSIFPVKRGERMAFGAFGLGPFFCGLYFMFNYVISVKTEYSNHYVNESFERGGSVYFRAEGIPCQDYPELCVVFMAKENALKKGDSIIVRMDRGMGGYTVLKEVKVISSTALKME